MFKLAVGSTKSQYNALKGILLVTVIIKQFISCTTNFNFLVQPEYLSVSHLFLQLSEFIEMQTQNTNFSSRLHT